MMREVVEGDGARACVTPAAWTAAHRHGRTKQQGKAKNDNNRSDNTLQLAKLVSCSCRHPLPLRVRMYLGITSHAIIPPTGHAHLIST